MLLLKLILTPLFIGTISVVGRRAGPVVSGWLIGLPLTSAPVTLFLALEQGTAFATRVAQGTLLGFISQAAFCVTYSWLAFRLNWPGCWLVGWGVFFALTFAFSHVLLPLPLEFTGVVSCLLAIFLLWPRQHGKVAKTRSPAWDIPARMLIATGLVLGLTGAAQALGPHLSGLLSPFPVFVTIFAIFTHHFQGATVVRQMLHGVLISSFACAVFFLVVAGLLTRWGVLATFSLAVLAALLTQGCALWLAKRYKISTL